MNIRYDPQTNALRIYLTDVENKPIHRTHVVNDLMLVDLAADGTPVSIELLRVDLYVANPETISLTLTLPATAK